MICLSEAIDSAINEDLSCKDGFGLGSAIYIRLFSFSVASELITVECRKLSAPGR